MTTATLLPLPSRPDVAAGRRGNRGPVAPVQSPAIALLAELAGRGVLLKRTGPDQLVASVPHGVSIDDRRDQIRALKPELLAALATYPCTACGNHAFHVPRCCYWCERSDS